MAIQTGVVRLRGRYGGFSFYRSGGLDIVRRAGGPTREQIRLGKPFAAVRANNREFGGASKAGTCLRHVFAPWVRRYGDRSLTGRLTQAFLRMCRADAGALGQRPVRASVYGEHLRGLRFGKAGLMPLPDAGVQLSDGGRRLRVCLKGFLPDLPEGARAMRFVFALGRVPDFAFDAVTGYTCAAPLPETAAWTESPLLDTRAGFARWTAELPFAAGAGGCTVLCAGMQFYGVDGGVPYALESGKVFGVAEVWPGAVETGSRQRQSAVRITTHPPARLFTAAADFAPTLPALRSIPLPVPTGFRRGP